MHRIYCILIIVAFLFVVACGGGGGGGSDIPDVKALSVNGPAPSFEASSLWQSDQKSEDVSNVWYKHEQEEEVSYYLIAQLDEKNGMVRFKYYQEEEFSPWVCLAQSYTDLDGYRYYASNFQIIEVFKTFDQFTVKYSTDLEDFKLFGELILNIPIIDEFLGEITGSIKGEIIQYPENLPEIMTFTYSSAKEWKSARTNYLNSGGIEYCADDFKSGEFVVSGTDFYGFNCPGIHKLLCYLDKTVEINAKLNDDSLIEAWASEVYNIPDKWEFKLSLKSDWPPPEN